MDGSDLVVARPRVRGRVRPVGADGDGRLRRRAAEPRTADAVLDRRRSGRCRASIRDRGRDATPPRYPPTPVHDGATNGSRVRKAWALGALVLAVVLPATTSTPTGALPSCAARIDASSVAGDLLLAVTGPPN